MVGGVRHRGVAGDAAAEVPRTPEGEHQPRRGSHPQTAACINNERRGAWSDSTGITKSSHPHVGEVLWSSEDGAHIVVRSEL